MKERKKERQATTPGLTFVSADGVVQFAPSQSCVTDLYETFSANLALCMNMKTSPLKFCFLHRLFIMALLVEMPI